MNKHSKTILVTYFGLWICYFIFFWSNAIFTDEAGHIVANHANIWGDWAAHFTMGSRMAYDKLLLLKSPFIINQTFSYPFASNLISALLVRAGMGFFNAFIIPSFFLSIFIIWALYYFYKKIFNSLTTAITASLIFLFNGGFGFVYFIQDIIESNQPLKTLLNPPQQYTNIEPLFYRWISVIDSMIIPQRAFSLGFPLTVIALTWIWSYFLKLKKKDKLASKKVFISALILGFMPLIHTHSFLAAFLIITSWMIGEILTSKKGKRSFKKWLPLALGVTVIALPLIQLFLFSQVSEKFIKWFPGWYSYEYPEENWLVFWIKNWGFIPLLSTLGLIRLIKNKKNGKLSLITFLPFFLIFILLNLFLFQPFIWDNTKLLVWVSLGFSGLTAHFFVSIWNKKQKRVKTWLIRIFLSLLFLVSIFSGLIDAYRAVRFKLHSHIMYSQEEAALAAWVKDNTNPESIWLTGDNHNNWLFNLTGRQALMTYPGWLWTHGYRTEDIEAAVTQMYKSPLISNYLFEEYQVDYIVVGPNEKRRWEIQAHDFNHLELIKSSKNYQIFAY